MLGLADEKAREEAVKAGQGDVLDAHKLGYQAYEWWDKEVLLDPKKCKACEKKKRARFGTNAPFPVCLDPACYRKKKSAKTRQENKTAEERKARLWKVAYDYADAYVDGPLPRAVLLFMLDTLMSHDMANAMAKRRDIPTKQESCVGQASPWKGTLYKQISEEDDASLRWTVTEALMQKQAPASLARFVWALAPEAYVQEFGAPPPANVDRYFSRLSDVLFKEPAAEPTAETPVPNETVPDTSGQLETPALYCRGVRVLPR